MRSAQSRPCYSGPHLTRHNDAVRTIVDTVISPGTGEISPRRGSAQIRRSALPSVGIGGDHVGEMTPEVESAVARQNCAPERQDRITVGKRFVAAPIGMSLPLGTRPRTADPGCGSLVLSASRVDGSPREVQWGVTCVRGAGSAGCGQHRFEVVPEVVDVFDADAHSQQTGMDMGITGVLLAPFDGGFHAAEAGGGHE